MVFDGLDAYAELFSKLTATQPPADEFKHSQFSIGKEVDG